MATIEYAKNLLKPAKLSAPLDAGEMYLSALRIAKKSKSKYAHEVMCAALEGVMELVNRATTQKEKSVLGGIRKQAEFIVND